MPLLAAENVVKSFAAPESPPVLRGVSLDIASGEFACVVGRSGSGKSTLLNILSSLLSPDGGSVRFKGRDLATMTEKERNRLRATDYSMVFQMHHLLPYLTVRENVLTPFLSGLRPVGAQRKRYALDCLAKVGLADKADRLPGALSGGERQRVAIARGLVTEPEILFADEPTGSLDGDTGAQIMDILRQLNTDGLTVVMVTHERAFAAMASRVIAIRDGLIV